MFLFDNNIESGIIWCDIELLPYEGCRVRSQHARYDLPDIFTAVGVILLVVVKL